MPENALLVTVDSLRFDHFPPENPVSDSPMAELAEASRTFESAFVTGPGTTPSFPALLTGTYPLSYGGLGPLGDERPRVAESLGRSGYATAGFQCNPFLSTHFDYDVGFGTFEDYQNPLMGLATKVFPRGIELNHPKLQRIDEAVHLTDAIKKTYRLVNGKPRPYVSAEVITDDAIEWIEDARGPFFCWTHYMDVHHPCYPPEQYRSAFGVAEVTQSDVSEWYSAFTGGSESLDGAAVENLEALYRAAIAYVDDQIGRLVDALKRSGKFEDTLIVLTSDHGELFGEHGRYGKPERMYDELLHVPLLVANGPASLDDATDELVSTVDVPPLVHDALGIDVPDAYAGRRPGVDPPREYVMAEHEVQGDVIVGARSADWLYEADEIRGERRLVDVSDGGFQRVAVEDHPDAAWLIDVVRDRLEALDVSPGSLKETVDGAVQDRLEDLGYLE